MPYDRHIDKTEEALQDLREVYGRSNVHRFMDGLFSGKFNTEEDVIKFTNYIRESDGRTQLELSRLKKLLAEGFLEQFATNFNKRYSTCHMLMNRMRSGISRGLRMLETLCSKKRSRNGCRKKRNVVENSKMGKGAYNLMLWGLEQCNCLDSVSTLYHEIRAYEGHLTDCIDLCLDVINQVAYIRNHPEIAYEKHQKNRRQVLENNRSVIKRFIEMNAEMENELMEKVKVWKQEKKSMEEISAMLYHALDVNEYNDWIISEEVMAARRDGLTNPECALWGDDKQQVMRCRVAYMHIGELNPEGQDGRIGGKFLAMLYKWSKVKARGLDHWLIYFTDFYKTSGGTLKPVKLGAVKRGIKQMTFGEIDADTIKRFNKKADELVDNYMIRTSDDEKGIKEAANF